MRVDFPPETLADPEFAASKRNIRKCVHCGFCTATCPTYVLLGDERDSPRGRIELIRAMLETPDVAPTKAAVTHIDRCLSCLACKTTCPSGVDYAQLIDHARTHVEATYRRPWPERLMRSLVPTVLLQPKRLRGALALGRIARPLAPLFELLRLRPFAALIRLVPPRPITDRTPPAQLSGPARGRVAVLQGCVEPAMAPSIRAAAARLLTRMGFEVVEAPGEGCCGALSEHLGRADEAAGMALRNVQAWNAVGPLDAIVATAAGCGTTLKAYGHRLGAEGASAAAMTRDILEFVAEAGLPPVTRKVGVPVAYHAPCSLQHGQGIKAAPAALLAQAGFEVREPAEAHLCCGSAGVYNILQPKLAGELRERKAKALAATGARIVAAGNIGCIAQIQGALPAAVIHPVELLDWATGGPQPAGIVGPA